ncbi:hypothetical protein EXIGLDRAFT_844101 [Exidia glandulosa HHB12029]|uniref:ZZ-type domain-containing protein n=1 Tax=Exidia glandulosa HHB12029 TaxID=1314781 RepID=A0A165C8U8_EXIGL|nr:hypothetical protein EXIGLDRAFT_844101 [Exidia glandulosa HHB12029]
MCLSKVDVYSAQTPSPVEPLLGSSYSTPLSTEPLAASCERWASRAKTVQRRLFAWSETADADLHPHPHLYPDHSSAFPASSRYTQLHLKTMKNPKQTDDSLTLQAQQLAGATVVVEAKQADDPVSIPPLKAVLDDLDPAQIYRAANAVAVGLESVQASYPFVKVVAQVFSAVVDVEQGRRGNDRRVAAIMSQVTDMVRTLLELNKIHSSTSQNRLQAICVDVAHDISEFGRACDMYSKTSYLVKFVKATEWRAQFAHFAEVFAARKSEIAAALSLETSLKIEHIETKLNDILDLLRVSADAGHSAELEREVDKRGGVEACIADDAALEALSRIAHDSARGTISPSDTAALRQDINTPLELQLEANRNRVRSEDLQSRAATVLTGINVPHTVHSDTLENLLDGGQSVHDYYEENSVAINDASQALMQLSLDVALKGSVNILPVIQKVMGALDCVERVHPFIGVAVLAFKGVVAVEIKRRENDHRVDALFRQMTDMMKELFPLNELSPEIITAAGKRSLASGQIDDILKTMEKEIVSCGNSIHEYCESTKLAKFFKAFSWETTFTTFVTTFDGLKKAIKTALAIRTTLSVDHISSQMSHFETKLSAIVQLLKTPTPTERLLEVAAMKYGGRDSSQAKSPEAVRVLLAVAGDVIPDGSTGFSSLMEELVIPLEKLLEGSKRSYCQILEAQISDLRANLRATIKASEDHVLDVLRAGSAFQNVQDPHLRHLWKMHNWPLSVSTVQFMAALQDYFVESYRSSRHLLKPTDGNAEPSMQPLSSADEWCIRFLDSRFAPTLKESLDLDGNGFVNVRELNKQLSSRRFLPDWPILRRLSYVAAGWHIEMLQYRIMILHLFQSMVDFSDAVLPANRSVVCAFLDGPEIRWVLSLIAGLSDLDDGGSDKNLTSLVSEHMRLQQVRLTTALESVRFDTSSPDVVSQLSHSQNLEKCLIPVVFLLLRRYAQVIRGANLIVLDRRELGAASLRGLMSLADARKEQLAKHFRIRGYDPTIKFGSFAKGLYRYIWDTRSFGAVEQQLWGESPRVLDDSSLQTTAFSPGILHYRSPDPIALAYGSEWPQEMQGPSNAIGLRARFQAVVQSLLAQRRKEKSWDYLALRIRHMRRYAELGKYGALETLRPMNSPSFLSTSQAEEFQRLDMVLVPRDLAYCRARADVELRNTEVVHMQISCQGCRRSPIVGVRYDCLDCGEDTYHLCASCIHQPEVASPQVSHTHHNMVEFKREIPSIKARLVLQEARIALRLHIPHDLPTTGLVASVGVSSLECSECHCALPEGFYCCITCTNLNSTASSIFCVSCAAREDGLVHAKAHESKDHVLALIQSREAESVTGRPYTSSGGSITGSAEQRLDRLEGRMDNLERKMDRILELAQSITTGMHVMLSK